MTEVDTTVFNSRCIKSNGLGRTQGQGKNKISMLRAAFEQSGPILPKVSSNSGGTLSGTFHIVTSDGAGPLKAVLDPTAKGKFSKGVMLDVITQVPGRGGNIEPQDKSNDDDDDNENAKNRLLRWSKRNQAVNINLDFPMVFRVPNGTTCEGQFDGVENVCLVKIANSNANGPFGGVVAIQMINEDAAAATSAAGSGDDAGTEGAIPTTAPTPTPTFPGSVALTGTLTGSSVIAHC